MTDTTKLLDGFEDWLAKWEKTMGEKHLFHDVAAFARIGASVMPRPISEAPKDGSRFLARTMERPPWSGIKYRWEEAWWHEGKTEMTGYFASVSGAIPEVFIPLSALPKPNEVTT